MQLKKPAEFDRFSRIANNQEGLSLPAQPVEKFFIRWHIEEGIISWLFQSSTTSDTNVRSGPISFFPAIGRKVWSICN